MKGNSKLAVAVALVALMVLLVAVFGRQQAPESARENALWLPELKPALPELRKVALQSSTERVTLERTEAGWGVVERSGYPVDFKRLEELLRALSQARLLEQKTSRPEYFSRLGLVDIEQPDSKAVLLELWSGAEQALVRVLIGDPAESRNGRYVRAASGSETWLIDQSPEPLTDAADWIDRHFLDVDFSRVERVTRTVPGGNGFVAVRETPGAASLGVRELPTGRKPRYEGVFDGAARAVLSAEIEDVKPLQQSDFAADKTATTLIETADGLGLEIGTIKDESGSWVRVRALAVVARAEDGSAQQVAVEGGDPDAASMAAGGAAPQQVDPGTINDRLGNWAFKVSDYVHGELSKSLEDYLEEPPHATGKKNADAG
ncbi:MAG: DUF4340 domain-containing protein [Gammaproteobacteria bacterium]|nr:DUF4340 domain-containing protein [Gammaproteobacteria bacterium]